jgi:phosphoglycerate kinase
MAIVWVDETDFDFENKRVFCRVDFNVPVSEDGTILDDSRIVAALPTLKFLLERKAKIVIASHLGRPKGKVRKSLSLVNVAERLQQLLDKDITFVEDCIGDGVRRLVSDMEPSQIVMLENLRFHSGEEKNDESFARMLAQNMDAYVDDAFGAVHRAHASVALVPTLIATRLGGMLMRKEIDALSLLLRSPKKPYVTVLGGAKVSDKLGIIGKLLGRVDKLIVGGAMAYTFLKAQGISVGASRVEDDRLAIARSILEKASAARIQIFLPEDHIVMQEFSEDSPTRVTNEMSIDDGWIGVDIGPKTQKVFTEALQGAHTIFWNGPMGVSEWPSCFGGTKAVVNAIAAQSGFKVAGGGDSLSALKTLKCADRFSHVSTGGGASLEFLEGAKLPGLEALGYGTFS